VRLLAGMMTVAALVSPQLHFPRDHLGHPSGVEWWYFTAAVDGSDGHRYSVFFTVFKRAGFVLPVSQVVSLDTGRIVRHTENLVRAPGLPFSSAAAGLRYDAARDEWAGRASTLAFTAHPVKPYVLHGGGTGVIRQGSGASHYYSATRMTIRGRSGAVRFTGTAWFDHQWGDFATVPSAQHWDWFSCRFDDRTELMLYRFRDGHENGTFDDHAGRGHAVGRFEAVPGARVFRAAGRRWPLDWTLRVPAERLTLRLHALVSDQLFRGMFVPTFWEGAVTATGTKTGVCFVEETS
jgi:predicted secreted hydrolase